MNVDWLSHHHQDGHIKFLRKFRIAVLDVTASRPGNLAILMVTALNALRLFVTPVVPPSAVTSDLHQTAVFGPLTE
jgi:hypothetical protein